MDLGMYAVPRATPGGAVGHGESGAVPLRSTALSGQGSAVSWQDINLLGEYDFSDEKLQDTVGIKPPKLALTVGFCTFEG